MTKDDILMHLRGWSYNASDVIGVYPLLTDETCRFLVYDFDNHKKGAEKKDFANEDLYIHLLLFHRRLRSLVAIELKISANIWAIILFSSFPCEKIGTCALI